MKCTVMDCCYEIDNPGGHLWYCAFHLFVHFKAMFKGCCHVSSCLLGVLTQTKVLKVLRLISLHTRISGAFRRDEQHSSGFQTGLASLPLHSIDFVHNQCIILFPALRCSSRVSPRSRPLPLVSPTLLLSPIKEWIPFEFHWDVVDWTI